MAAINRHPWLVFWAIWSLFAIGIWRVMAPAHAQQPDTSAPAAADNKTLTEHQRDGLVAQLRKHIKEKKEIKDELAVMESANKLLNSRVEGFSSGADGVGDGEEVQTEDEMSVAIKYGEIQQKMEAQNNYVAHLEQQMKLKDDRIAYLEAAKAALIARQPLQQLTPDMLNQGTLPKPQVISPSGEVAPNPAP